MVAAIVTSIARDADIESGELHASSEGAEEALLKAIRFPTATLPSFVNEEFLGSAVHFVRTDIRRMHEERAWIRAVTGFPWPEEKPTVEQMPGIYLEALRYPAFAIAVQHQFFSDDYARGFPKNQIVRQFADTAHRILRDHPIPRTEAHLSVTRALHVLKNGGDRHMVLVDLLSLPGQVAWRSPCSKVADGLDALEQRGDEIAEIGRYLRSVVEPFVQFGDEEPTIGDVFEDIVIPFGLKLPVVSIPDHPSAVADPIAASIPRESSTEEEVGNSAELPAGHESAINEDAIGTVAQAWQERSVEIRLLAEEAATLGPNDSTIKRLGILLIALESIQVRALQLSPRLVQSSPLIAQLAELISNVASALQSHIGESLDSSDVASAALRISDEVEPSAFATGETLHKEALSEYELSEGLATEIAELEKTLPMKLARDRTAPLVDSREHLLRHSLLLAKNSVDALLTGSKAVPVEDAPAEVLTAMEPTSADTQEQVLPEVNQAITVDEILDVPLDDGADAEEELSPQSIEPIIDAKPEVPEIVEDPLRNDVIACLDHLFIAGEFGLAFHLVSAATAAMPDTSFTYSAAEFRLASASGRATGLSGQDLQSLADARSEALIIAQELADQTDNRSIARRMTLLAGAIAPALFRSDDMSAVSLVENIGGKGATAHYFQLVSAVEENRKRGFPITAASLGAVEAYSRERDFVREAVDTIKATVEGFRSSRFRFQLGEKVKYAITQPDGLLGNLLGSIDASPYDIAKVVGNDLKNRDAIVNYLTRVTGEIGSGNEIDGVARERLIGILSQVGQQCMDLSESMDSFNALRRSGGQLDTIKRLRDLALVGIEKVLSSTSESADNGLLDAANAHAASMLLTLRDTLRGKLGLDRDPMPLAVALHGPLLWLPKLNWTGAWTPSPYNPDVILQEIMSTAVPLLEPGPATSVKNAFEDRRAEFAFVPAYMLLNIAHWFGVSQTDIDGMRAKLDADKDVKKSQIKTRLNIVERMIDRMRRMAIGSLEQSARLKETLTSINPERLPVELPPDFLPETVLGDRVEDFNSAFNRIRDVESEAKREFDKVSADYAGKIHSLDKDGKLDPETGKQLRKLLEGLEFTTLADWLNMLQTGEIQKPRLPSGRINRRLEFFKAALPSLSSVDLLQVARAVESGKGIGPVDYSHLDDYRREEGARIIRMFIELKRAVKKPETALQVQAKLTETVSNLFYEVSGPIVDEVLTRLRQGIYVCDVKVALPPTDPTSLVLPEFGSLTQGSWRVCVVAPTIAQSDLLNLGEGAGLRGVIVYVLGVLNAERRDQLRVELSKRRRAMLVIDEALIAVTIADSEDRRRAAIEIAQGYSGADPYKDHGKSAVPAEMFKGRAVERGEIVKPFGSYVVYGGRRLGKTALLQQISATQPANTVFAYVDLDMVIDASDAFERIVRKIGDEVVKSTVRSGSEFSAAVLAWLDADERRRIVLLLDEADNFVRQETESGFRCIQTMLQLMAETTNRFKFVLAGLHNVSRSLRTENSPLVQISNNPIQIGPLLNRDVDDAELLVRGPLAAMGFEFDSREDVWRILSFTNYYPVLIQIFCQELLRLIHTQVQQTNKLPASISTSLVERALSSSDVRGKLFQTFEKTINSIEGRYELITYILAARELMERDSGMAAEGATAAEVAERAMEYWPAAFQKGSDPADLEYLLEEMEGFGIARRTPSGRFALRSRSLLELMAASEDELNRKLESFRNERAPPKPFDPKNYRRPLSPTGSRKDGDVHMSPLTDGQEADLFSPLHSSGISAVFGTNLAGIQFVETALGDARRVKDGSISVEVRNFANKKEMLDEAKRPIKGARQRVLVVASRSSWNPDWVVEAERLGRRRQGELRIIFVGDPKHARAWAGDETVGKRALPQIKIIKLRPWSRSFLGTRVDGVQLPGDLVDRIYEKTGGWNEVVGPLMQRISEKPGEHATLISAAAASAVASSTLLPDLGIPSDLIGFFRELAMFAEGSTITTTDFQYLCTSDGRRISPRIVGAYSDLLGIISFAPNQGAGQGHRKVDVNPLVLAALLRPE